VNLAMAGVMDEPQISEDVRAALFLRHHMVDVGFCQNSRHPSILGV
jgi:hypothetical protein